MNVIIFVLLLCPSVFAGYENTNWDMTVDDLAKLFPGGEKSKDLGGGHNYSVVQDIAGLSPGYVSFKFDSQEKFTDVLIFLPKPGSKVNLKTGTYREATTEESVSIFETLKNTLTLKYGKPDPASKQDIVAWISKENDLVVLSKSQNSGLANRTTVLVSYSKYTNQNLGSQTPRKVVLKL